MAEAPLPVLYRDARFIAVNKPSGLLVHRTELDAERDVALQRVRDQIGQRVYPVHRLDRATSGALVFGLDPSAAAALATAFRGQRVGKLYLAVVRGWPPPSGVIDRPIARRRGGEKRPARTRFRTLATVQLPIPVSKWPTARYALVVTCPLSGRRHQIRRHLAAISHPVAGDTTHGDGRHNRLLRNHFDSHRLLLHAWRISWPQENAGRVRVSAPLPPEASRVLGAMGLVPGSGSGHCDGVAHAH